MFPDPSKRLFCPIKHGLRQLVSNTSSYFSRLQPCRFGIAARGKFDNISGTPLAVAISKR